jgi:hypothetical protein
MKDLTEGQLQEQLEFAKTINDESLQHCLDNIKRVEENYKERGQTIETEIYLDWAKRSFAFYRKTPEGQCILNGGIIYHGSPNEGYQEGGSVQINPSYGWQIHT